MTDESLVSAAHHEAGHVIMGQSQGFMPKYVEIEYNSTMKRWEGTTEFPPLSAPSVDEKITIQIAVCVAGCFAQVKHAIRLVDPCELVPWKGLFEWMVFRSSEPFELSLSSGGRIHISSWWFEGQDKEVLDYIADQSNTRLGADRFVVLLQQAVRQTAVPVLDDFESWGKLEYLANLLVNATDEGVGRLESTQVPR